MKTNRAVSILAVSVAMILAACMMLDHIGEDDRAKRIRDAVGRVVSEGRTRTYDMLRLPGGPDVFARGAATTQQMTDAIIADGCRIARRCGTATACKGKEPFRAFNHLPRA